MRNATWVFIALALGGCQVPSPPPAMAASPAPQATPAPIAASSPQATPAPRATVAIDWERGITGLGFHDYFGPSLASYDVARSDAPAEVVIYRLYGPKLAKDGLQPASRALGWDVWQFDFHVPAKQRSYRGQPGSGLPIVSRELTTPADVYRDGYAIDRAAVKVDSPAAAAAAQGAADGDIWLISAAEYRELTGRAATAPVWRVQTGGGKIAHVDAATGAVLPP